MRLKLFLCSLLLASSIANANPIVINIVKEPTDFAENSVYAYWSSNRISYTLDKITNTYCSSLKSGNMVSCVVIDPVSATYLLDKIRVIAK